MSLMPPGGAIYVNGRFLAQPLTGVQRYSRELLGALDQLAETGEIDPAGRLVCLAPPGIDAPAWRHVRVQAVGSGAGNLWEQVRLPLAAVGGLLFSPGNIGPYLHPRQVVTLHDASVFAYPQAYTFTFRLKYRLLLRRLGRIARQVITVSHFSRNELIRACGIPAERICVIPHGHEHLLRVAPDERILDRSGLTGRPYLLAVGSASPHKNLAGLVEAMRGFPGSGPVLAVAGGSFPGVFQGQPLDLPPNVRRLGYVSDGELRALYQHAQALVLPSLYEGFGLPLLEAMAFDCPVVCSNRASLPEVAGDAALYFDPTHPTEIRAQIEVALQPAVADALRQRGRARRAHFIWANAARQVWQYLAS
jgi:glycosyltransferase involved in cell wall biosynthesis